MVSYRYGFNGMEKDDELKGSGISCDFGARLYDSRVGKFLSLDPDMMKYPHMSPYCFATNSPVRFVDWLGRGPGDRVAYAEQYLETDYVQQYEWENGQRTYLRTGVTSAALENIDCSELVSRIMAADGLTGNIVSYSTAELVDVFESLYETSNVPQAGDFFLWRYQSDDGKWHGHTGLVKGYDAETDQVTIIHAKGTADDTVEETYDLSYFTDHAGWKGFSRPLEETDETRESMLQGLDNQIQNWTDYMNELETDEAKDGVQSIITDLQEQRELYEKTGGAQPD